MKFSKDRIFLTTVVIVLAFVAWRAHSANKAIEEKAIEYQQQISRWQMRSLKYERCIDSLKNIELSVKDSINTLAKEVGALNVKIKKLQYETSVKKHVDNIDNTVLLDSIRARYTHKRRE